MHSGKSEKSPLPTKTYCLSILPTPVVMGNFYKVKIDKFILVLKLCNFRFSYLWNICLPPAMYMQLNRSAFHLLVHSSSNACKSQGWIRLKQEPGTPPGRDPSTSDIICCLPGHSCVSSFMYFLVTLMNGKL